MAGHQPADGPVLLTGLQALVGLGRIRLKCSIAWLTAVSASWTADFVLWSRTVPLCTLTVEATPTLTMAKAAISISSVVGSANPLSARSLKAIRRTLRTCAELLAFMLFPLWTGPTGIPSAPLGGATYRGLMKRPFASIKRLVVGKMR